MRVGGCINETNTMFLARSERHIIILSRSIPDVFALNKTCVPGDGKTREFFHEEEF
jgi:hypothetical protein